MKKALILTAAAILFLPTQSFSAGKDCRYHPIQQVIRSARSEKDIEKEIAKKTNFNIQFPCGGSILQLAVIRGNPHVLQALLEKGNLNPNEMVSTAEFPIKGAPKVIPISFFAAYYAPRGDILNLFVNHAGNSIYQKDLNGQNILWYLEQNPVLNDTDISDQIIDNLVLIDSEKQNERDRKEQEEAAKKLEQTQARQSALQQKTSAATSTQTAPEMPQKKRQPNLIEQEPDKAFKPNEKEFDLQGSDF